MTLQRLARGVLIGRWGPNEGTELRLAGGEEGESEKSSEESWIIRGTRSEEVRG